MIDAAANQRQEFMNLLLSDWLHPKLRPKMNRGRYADIDITNNLRKTLMVTRSARLISLLAVTEIFYSNLN